MKKLIVLMAAMMTFATTAFAQLGSLASDLVYTPVTPCRVFDTRPSQGGSGPIAAAGTKNFFIWGASSYATQGGSPTNCGITAGSNTAAVAMNVTVVTPAAGGFVTAYPFGATLPTAATVNFQAGDIARGNFTIAKVSQAGATDLSVYSTSNADVVGDVVGYFSKPVATALECVTTTPVTSSINQGPLNGLYYNFAVSAACTSGYTEVALRCTTSNAFASATADGPSPGYCGGNSPVNSHTVSASRTCCRIPGR